PYPLDNVKVWALAWPVKEGHMTAGEPVLGVLGLVFWIIILLENEATTKRIACIQTHGVLKDVFIRNLSTSIRLKGPMPKRETHPQTMTFPNPCFIV
ncbi:hypothetical protein AVEN_69375-1, partial [Araneus ventricosus]